MKLQIVAALVLAGALAGCNSSRDKVADAQKDATEARQDARKDVSDAQAKAVKDINDTKESAAKDIQKKDDQLNKAEANANQGTTSGSTSGVMGTHEVRVSPEECARLAKEKSVKPEDRALYDACSHMKKEDLKR